MAKVTDIHVPYDRPALMTYQGPADCDDPLRSAGTACVGFTRGTDMMELRVMDGSGLPVGGAYYLHTRDGGYVDSGVFCGAASIVVPIGTATGVIRLEGHNGPLVCADHGQASTPATSGVVAIRLR